MSEIKFRREDPPVVRSGRKSDYIESVKRHLQKNPNKWFALRDCPKRGQAASAAFYLNSKRLPGYEFISRNKTVYGLYRPAK